MKVLFGDVCVCLCVRFSKEAKKVTYKSGKVSIYVTFMTAINFRFWTDSCLIEPTLIDLMGRNLYQYRSCDECSL